MGMYARAGLVYGIDLGDPEYGESFVEYDHDVYEDGINEALEDLIKEFQGFTEPRPEGYGDEWEAWNERRRAFTKEQGTDTLGYGSYGYEYAGTVVSIVSAGSATYEAKPIEPPTVTDAQRGTLLRFISFLESKGFVFGPAHREPRWLLTASYG